MLKNMQGTKILNKAESFVGEITIHKAQNDHIRVLKSKGITIFSPGLPSKNKLRTLIE